LPVLGGFFVLVLPVLAVQIKQGVAIAVILLITWCIIIIVNQIVRTANMMRGAGFAPIVI
jgi:hypothetical protein